MLQMGEKTTREEELAGRRWQKKSTIDEPRLSELVQTYRRIGCEVHLEPFDPLTQPGCSDCMKTAGKNYKTIYIRKAGSGAAAGGAGFEPRNRSTERRTAEEQKE